MSAFGVIADIGCLLFESEALLRCECPLSGVEQTPKVRFQGPMQFFASNVRLQGQSGRSGPPLQMFANSQKTI